MPLHQHQQNHPHMMIPTNQVCSALGVASFGLITNHYSLSSSGNAAAWPGPATAVPTPRWSNDDATESQHCRPARAVPASPATTSSATASNRRTSRLSHVPVKSANCSVCFAPSGQSKISVKYNNIDSIKNEILLFYHHYHPQTIKCSSCPLVLLRHRRRILNKRDFHNPSIDSLREKAKDAQLVQWIARLCGVDGGVLELWNWKNKGEGGNQDEIEGFPILAPTSSNISFVLNHVTTATVPFH